MEQEKINLENNNPYLPDIATVKKIINETPAIISLQIVIDDDKKW